MVRGERGTVRGILFSSSGILFDPMVCLEDEGGFDAFESLGCRVRDGIRFQKLDFLIKSVRSRWEYIGGDGISASGYRCGMWRVVIQSVEIVGSGLRC